MYTVQIYIYMYFKILWFCDFQEYTYISFKACIIPKYLLITASHRLMCISCVIDNPCTSSSSQRWEYLSVPRMAGVTFFFVNFWNYTVSQKNGHAINFNTWHFHRLMFSTDIHFVHLLRLKFSNLVIFILAVFFIINV